MYCKFLLVFFMLILVQPWTVYMVTSTSNITDLNSLIAFKNAIEIDPSNVLARNWTTDINFCNWYGVSCSKRRQRVTALEILEMGLVGKISPQLGNLSFLTVLNLNKNKFYGPVIEELGYLRRLRILRLGGNKLRGEIPISLSMCQNLEQIILPDNRLTGPLSKNLTTLPRLQIFGVGLNNFTGEIPSFFGNMTTLQWLGLELNQFHGNILTELAFLPKITGLYLNNNYLTGTIPSSFFNISSLKVLALSTNPFTGVLPKDTSLQLPSLKKLYLAGTQLTGSIPSHLYNVSELTLLSIENSNFTGPLLAALPQSLQILSASDCNLQGEIPKEIGSLKYLTLLKLPYNRFSGTIPATIKGMENMQRLNLNNNALEGPIPEEICSLKNLGEIHLEMNRLSGSIPECIGNLHVLQLLVISSNVISSTIPRSLWSLDQLVNLNLSSNKLQGDLSLNISTMRSLNVLDLSRNQLAGNIPAALGYFKTLNTMDLSWNTFSGPIPESFGNLVSLAKMDLSRNNLSGHIPKSLKALTYLDYLNVSYNKLSGEIPIGGPFVNLTSQSFIGNLDLCGEYISKPCTRHGLKKSTNKWFHLSYVILIVVVVLIIGVFLYFSSKRRRTSLHQNPRNALQEQIMISYHELSRATNGFSEANFLGSGGFGQVYKGTLFDGRIVAVKLLNLTVDGAIKSFDAECKVLRTVRHRNLVKVITSCTNLELRALVLEYIPNGSLEKWLYSHNYCLSFLQRVSIMLDVAVALDYLHCGQSEQVIHCDLKPSNVLLDNDMVAHVGDFGIAKILAANKLETHTATLGTLGYMAPEYGTEGRVSTKGDVYSFGIMLLETFTRKKPTDEIFLEETNLRQWVSSSVPDNIGEVVDENLVNENDIGRLGTSSQDVLLDLLDIGLGCSRDSPEERFEMKEVVMKLNKIKLQILSR